MQTANKLLLKIVKCYFLKKAISFLLKIVKYYPLKRAISFLLKIVNMLSSKDSIIPHRFSSQESVTIKHRKQAFH